MVNSEVCQVVTKCYLPLTCIQTICGVQTRLVPYFLVNHPTRGEINGPFHKLPESSALRRLVLDLVVTLSLLRDEPILEAAVLTTIHGSPQESYWISTWAARKLMLELLPCNPP